MDRLAKRLIVLTSVAALSSASLFAQETLLRDSDIHLLDSLMANVEFGEIQAFFHKQDSRLIKDEHSPYVLLMYSLRKNRYLKAIDAHRFLSMQDSTYLISQINQMVDSPHILTQESIGQKAHEAYLKLIDFSKKREFDRALQFLPVVHYFWARKRMPDDDSLIVARSSQIFDDNMTHIKKLYLHDKPDEGDSSGQSVKLLITSDVWEASVYLDGKLIGQTPRLSASLKPGRHQLFVHKETYNLFRLDFDISPADTAVAINSVLSDAWIKVAKEPKEAEVYIDGRRYELLSDEHIIGLHRGPHRVMLKHQAYETKTYSILVESPGMTTFPFQLRPKSRTKAALYSTLLPGLGQYYSESRIGIRSVLYPILELSLLYGAKYYDAKISDLVPQYNDAQFWYVNSYSDENRQLANERRRQIYGEMKDFRLRRTIFFGLAIATWIFNIVDAYDSDYGTVGKRRFFFHLDGTSPEGDMPYVLRVNFGIPIYLFE